jgi:threonine dehydrogenase-like Zn-dependent dehydrogenase
MKAIVKYEEKPGAVKVMERPRPVPGAHDVLVAIKATGICYTDMSIIKGEYKGRKPVPIPVILGHEGSGTVAEIGAEVRGFTPGERVAFEALNGCGRCLNCRNGFKNMCTDWTHVGITRDGTFAEYLSLPDVMVHKLPDSVSFADAAVLEPLSLVVRSLEHVQPIPGETAVIIGPGSVGLLHLQALKASGVEKVIVIGIEKDVHRVAIAESLGADVIVYSDKEDPTRAVMNATGGLGADIVIETANHPVVWDYLLDIVAARGRISTFGLYPEARIKPLVLLRKGATIYGDVAFLSRHFVRAIKWLETKKVSGEKLITKRFALDQMEDAFTTFRGGETIKVLFEP